MAFIIKPLVTEKMTRITDQSSVEKKIYVSVNRADTKGAVAEKVGYDVKNRKGEVVKHVDKTKYAYTKSVLQKYGFIVKPEANKLEIKKEVEALYNVTVLDVNTCRYAGKRSSRYTKAGLVKGQKNAYKKAVVTLKEGDTIDFYSNI